MEVQGDSEGLTRTKEKGRRRKSTLKKRDDCNITPLLHPKLQRRITYEWCSEVDIGRDQGASHVADGNVILFEVLQRRMRARGRARMRVATMDMRILGDHSSRTWGRDRMWLGGG